MRPVPTRHSRSTSHVSFLLCICTSSAQHECPQRAMSCHTGTIQRDTSAGFTRCCRAAHLTRPRISARAPCQLPEVCGSERLPSIPTSTIVCVPCAWSLFCVAGCGWFWLARKTCLLVCGRGVRWCLRAGRAVVRLVLVRVWGGLARVGLALRGPWLLPWLVAYVPASCAVLVLSFCVQITVCWVRDSNL